MESPASNQANLRVAIISTPRSGNSWMRHLFQSLYGIPAIAHHEPAEVPWETLPAGCVLQIHWHRTPAFCQQLADYGFQVVTLARHPLDVLISILHFCLHDASTLRWLAGEGGDERSIYGAMPGSAAFQAYAVSQRAAALLSITSEWWSAPAVHRMRYESLVENPVREMEKLAAGLGVTPIRPVAEAVNENTLEGQRARTGHAYHFWKGQPGLWRRLLPKPLADPIIARHREFLAAFGYEMTADSRLTPLEADALWTQLVGTELVEGIQSMHVAKRELRTLQGELASVRNQLAEARADQEACREAYRNLDTQFQSIKARLEDVGPMGAEFARRMRRMFLRAPRIQKVVRPMLRNWLGDGR